MHLSPQEQFYLRQPIEYLDSLQQMAYFNCGAVLLKNRLYDEAYKFWTLVNDSINFHHEIPMLYNLCLVEFLNNHVDSSLERCQDLVRAICVYLTQESNFKDEFRRKYVDFIKIDHLVGNCLVVLNAYIEHLERMKARLLKLASKHQVPIDSDHLFPRYTANPLFFEKVGLDTAESLPSGWYKTRETAGSSQNPKKEKQSVLQKRYALVLFRMHLVEDMRYWLHKSVKINREIVEETIQM